MFEQLPPPRQPTLDTLSMLQNIIDDEKRERAASAEPSPSYAMDITGSPTGTSKPIEMRGTSPHSTHHPSAPWTHAYSASPGPSSYASSYNPPTPSYAGSYHAPSAMRSSYAHAGGDDAESAYDPGEDGYSSYSGSVQGTPYLQDTFDSSDIWGGSGGRSPASPAPGFHGFDVPPSPFLAATGEQAQAHMTPSSTPLFTSQHSLYSPPSQSSRSRSPSIASVHGGIAPPGSTDDYGMSNLGFSSPAVVAPAASFDDTPLFAIDNPSPPTVEGGSAADSSSSNHVSHAASSLLAPPQQPRLSIPSLAPGGGGLAAPDINLIEATPIARTPTQAEHSIKGIVGQRAEGGSQQQQQQQQQQALPSIGESFPRSPFSSSVHSSPAGGQADDIAAFEEFFSGATQQHSQQQQQQQLHHPSPPPHSFASFGPGVTAASPLHPHLSPSPPHAYAPRFPPQRQRSKSDSYPSNQRPPELSDPAFQPQSQSSAFPQMSLNPHTLAPFQWPSADDLARHAAYSGAATSYGASAPQGFQGTLDPSAVMEESSPSHSQSQSRSPSSIGHARRRSFNGGREGLGTPGYGVGMGFVLDDGDGDGDGGGGVPPGSPGAAVRRAHTTAGATGRVTRHARVRSEDIGAGAGRWNAGGGSRAGFLQPATIGGSLAPPVRAPRAGGGIGMGVGLGLGPSSSSAIQQQQQILQAFSPPPPPSFSPPSSSATSPAPGHSLDPYSTPTFFPPPSLPPLTDPYYTAPPIALPHLQSMQHELAGASSELARPIVTARPTTQRTRQASEQRRKAVEDGKEKKLFRCEVPGCGSTFTRQFNLKGHMRSHTNEKPFKCSILGCNKAFARQHDRKRHEALHNDDKPFRCGGCGKTFARLDALARHHNRDAGQDCARAHETMIRRTSEEGESSSASASASDSAATPSRGVLL